MNFRRLAFAFSLALILIAGCGGTTGGNEGPLEIIGTWVDGYGSIYQITQDKITIDGQGNFNITTYSNTKEYCVAQNDATNEFNPSKYSRFDWANIAGNLYICQITYDSATEQSAESATTANRKSTDTGCNGFAWSVLTKKALLPQPQ